MIKKDSLFARLLITNITIIVITILTISIASFYISERLIIKTFTSANNKMLDQIGVNLIDFHTENVILSNQIRLNKSIRKNLSTKPKDSLEHYKMLHHMQQYYKNLDLPYLYLTAVGINSMSYSSNIESSIINFDVIKSNFFDNSSNIPDISYNFLPNGMTTSTENKGVLVFSRILRHNLNNPYGVLFITMDEAKFSDIYTQTLSPGNTISIIKPDGFVISSSNKELVGNIEMTLYESAYNIVNLNQVSSTINFNGSNYILLAKYVPYLDCYIVNSIDYQLALSPILKMKSFILILSIFILTITIIAIFLLSRKITLPLNQMIKVMSNTTNDNFRQQININGSYEVRVLGHTFNTMINEIENHIDCLIKEQEERRKAELYALQMQINPHFLYNTLSAIKYLSWSGNPDQVSITIDALISLLQNTVGKIDEIISVEDEIQNLKDYVTIAKTRYGDKISVSFDVAPDCEKESIPKLILQPFVENAFFHGFQDTSKGTIRIQIYKFKNDLICEIIDNGDGIDPNKLPDLVIKERQKKHLTGIGIQNVNERIKILYGDNYGVSIISEKGIGTCITLRLPVNYL